MTASVKICDNCLYQDQPIGMTIQVVEQGDGTCEWDGCTENVGRSWMIETALESTAIDEYTGRSFVIETWTFADGFVNTWTEWNESDADPVPEPATFSTEAHAEKALDDFLEEQHFSVDAGDMGEKYDRADFRIRLAR